MPSQLTPAAHMLSVNLPGTNGRSCLRNQRSSHLPKQTFVDGVLFRTLTTTPLYHDASAAEVYSGVRFDGRAVCTGVTCTVNGADYPCTYMPDSSVETGTVRFLTAGLANGDTIVLTFQYAYTDADTDYEVSAFHEFYADTSLSTDALLEIRPGTVLLRKPGETFTVSALRMRTPFSPTPRFMSIL